VLAPPSGSFKSGCTCELEQRFWRTKASPMPPQLSGEEKIEDFRNLSEGNSASDERKRNFANSEDVSGFASQTNIPLIPTHGD